MVYQYKQFHIITTQWSTQAIGSTVDGCIARLAVLAIACLGNIGSAWAGGANLVPAETAVAIAVNDVVHVDTAYHVKNPLHRAVLSPDGVEFSPTIGGLKWQWQLESIRLDGGRTLSQAGRAPAGTQRQNSIQFTRGEVIEEYVLKTRSMEQRFVISAPLSSEGHDLIVEGAVQADALFSETDEGWQWGTGAAAVRLGDVYVFDANGHEVPARMVVNADSTRIVVDGGALAGAAYPVTIDPEIATSDIRISDMGPDQTGSYPAFNARSAYNSTNNEFLVVWRGEDNTAPVVNGENEIYGQRIDAATGAELGVNDFRISDLGDDGETTATVRDNFLATEPSVAYNSTNNEYLVVWWGDDDTGALVDDEFEVYGQRLDGATGAEIGTNDFRISDMGSDGDTNFSATGVDLVYNSTENEYLAVWSGEDDTAPLVDGEYEIYCQRLNAETGAEVGTNDMRVSDMGDESETNAFTRDNFGARNPKVAYNGTNNEYLIVWEADDDAGALIDHESEIWGQFLDGASGAEVGTNDFRISDMGASDGSFTFLATGPDVAHNSTNNEFLVVWRGVDDTAPLVANESEILGQRIDAISRGEVGTNDFRISDMGDDSETDSVIRQRFGTSSPTVAYNVDANEYLVAWTGDDDSAPLVDGELEVFIQRISGATGAEVGVNDFRLSDMGDDSESNASVRDNYQAVRVEVIYGTTNDCFLLSWDGQDDSTNVSDNTLVSFEREVFIRFFVNPNTEPDAIDDALSVDEDSMGNVLDVLDNDSDVDGDSPTITALGALDQGGSAQIAGDSLSITYAPAADFVGTETFTYTIDDGNSGTDTATVTVTVGDVNDDPTAVDDTAMVAEDATNTTFDLLDNDLIAPDTGETLTITAVGTPDNGGAVMITNSGADVGYAPAGDFLARRPSPTPSAMAMVGPIAERSP